MFQVQPNLLKRLKFTKLPLGETNLICWSTGANDPILIKNKEVVLKKVAY